jgi:hypothetical protein
MKRVKRYLDVFLPLLTGHKKRAALLVNEYIDSRLSKSYKSPPTPEELGIIEALRNHNGQPNKRVTSLAFLRDFTSDVQLGFPVVRR